jgi:hypothetical protein
MYKVKEFEYNGLFVNFIGGEASYTAKFSKWTTDPGIVICKCSDGEERLIPTCALIGLKYKDLPEQTNMVNGMFFGIPSDS